MDNLFLLLGCFGLREDNFISCPSVENNILLMDPSLYKYNEMMDLFDQFKLFDRPIFDYNAIRHLIFNLQENFDQLSKKLWTEKKFELLQKFTINHRFCGLYSKLVLIPASKIEAPKLQEDKGIFIPASKIEDPTENHILNVIRGRT